MPDKHSGIWSLGEAAKRHRFDEELANTLVKTFPACRVIDIGCGLGEYCTYFDQHYVKVLGIEGTVSIDTIAQSNRLASKSPVI